MDRMLFISMSGAKEVALAQANNSNNLANANTDGFKQDFNQFRAQHVEGPGWESRAYAMDERPATDFTPGAVKVTGRSMDVMTGADGFLSIQAPDGSVAYTRTLALETDAQGNLKDVNGYPVLNEGGSPINLPPFKDINIGNDGTISIIAADNPNGGFVAVDRLSVTSPDVKQLQKEEDGFIRFKGGDAPAQSNTTVVSGALETSNVNTVDALATMIELSRKYEMQVKMMKTSKDHAAKSDSLVKLN